MAFCMKCGKEIEDCYELCEDCLSKELGAPQEEKYVDDTPFGLYCSGALTKDEYEKIIAAEKASGGLILLSILIPTAGVVLGIAHLTSGKKHAGKVYLWIGILVWVVRIVEFMARFGVLFVAKR